MGVKGQAEKHDLHDDSGKYLAQSTIYHSELHHQSYMLFFQNFFNIVTKSTKLIMEIPVFVNSPWLDFSFILFLYWGTQ